MFTCVAMVTGMVHVQDNDRIWTITPILFVVFKSLITFAMINVFWSGKSPQYVGIIDHKSIACGGNACGVKHIYIDSKVTNFATFIMTMRKVKLIGLNPTTRFEDIELNCGLGWSKTIKEPKSIYF